MGKIKTPQTTMHREYKNFRNIRKVFNYKQSQVSRAWMTVTSSLNKFVILKLSRKAGWKWRIYIRNGLWLLSLYYIISLVLLPKTLVLLFPQNGIKYSLYDIFLIKMYTYINLTTWKNKILGINLKSHINKFEYAMEYWCIKIIKLFFFNIW